MDEPQIPEEEEDMLKFPYREAVGAFIWTATMTRPEIACAVRAGQVLETLDWRIIKDGDVGHILPASHERVGDHVQWAG